MSKNVGPSSLVWHDCRAEDNAAKCTTWTSKVIRSSTGFSRSRKRSRQMFHQSLIGTIDRLATAPAECQSSEILAATGERLSPNIHTVQLKQTAADTTMSSLPPRLPPEHVPAVLFESLPT